jgi:hypothetical protein
MLSTIMMPARVQVSFSRKSVVLRTPIIWLEEENPLARPPPFDFCTSTTRIIRMAASKMRMVMKIYISLVNCF